LKIGCYALASLSEQVTKDEAGCYQRYEARHREEVVERAVQSGLKDLIGRSWREAVHWIGHEDPGANQTYRPPPDQEESKTRAFGGSKQTPQTDGKGQDQKARNEKVEILDPTKVAQGQ
jgi:hypothetical protein